MSKVFDRVDFAKDSDMSLNEPKTFSTVVNNDDILQMYLKEIGRKKMLTKKEEMELKGKYICDSDIYKKFKMGDKVKIITPEHKVTSLLTGKTSIVPEAVRYAFIIGYEINFMSDVCLQLKAAKKDGEISKKRDYYTHNERIEAIE